MREDVKKAYDQVNDLEDALATQRTLNEALTIQMLLTLGVTGEYGKYQVIIPKLSVLDLCGAYEVRVMPTDDGKNAMYLVDRQDGGGEP